VAVARNSCWLGQTVTLELERFCQGAAVLILDGAIWRRTLFSHLTIEESHPHVRGWSIDSIFLIQIGRSVPPHAELQRKVAAICAGARAAYDGLVVRI
jgi:hypothetical protein